MAYPFPLPSEWALNYVSRWCVAPSVEHISAWEALEPAELTGPISCRERHECVSLGSAPASAGRKVNDPDAVTADDPAEGGDEEGNDSNNDGLHEHPDDHDEHKRQ